ncbi:MAG TPA: phospholipase D family protein, partial [Acidobacteriota bacterium]|nr:phospholipase D family protein [Acidobacteriota bacterium]
DELDALAMQIKVVHLPAPNPLHAKFYWLDGPDGTAAVVGSANCSAAAWLQPPAAGGNIEVIAAYENADPAEYPAILNLFESDDLKPVTLQTGFATMVQQPTTTLKPFSDSPDIQWHSDTGEIMLRFKAGLPAALTVEFLPEHGLPIIMRNVHGDGRVWAAELGDLSGDARTLFGTVILRSEGREHARYFKWINDVRELAIASKARRWEPILTLGRNQNQTEQKRMLARIQEIALALITEPESFPDPVGHGTQKKGADKSADSDRVEPVNPLELIKSIEELKDPKMVGGIHSDLSFSLAGVMRALFDLPETNSDEESESDESDPDGQGDDKKKKEKHPEKPQDSKIRESYKTRLHAQIEDFLSRMGSPEFAANATATQLVQAAAFPLAIAFRGRRLSWVNPERARDWTVTICDLLFRRSSGSEKHGLLACIRKRYEAEGRDTDFMRIVADGTLWLALLSSLAVVKWRGRNSGIERALALRSVLEAQDLIQSSEPGRMRALLRSLDAERARAVVTLAPAVIERLKALENYLALHQVQFLARQIRNPIHHEVGDLLWYKSAGWAEARTGASCDANLDAYLHMRAKTVLVKGSFYINVSKAAETDASIRDLIGEVEGLTEKVVGE